jgi:hypothetical protein
VRDTPPLLAEQARSFRWWLLAARRSPVLCALIILQFLIVPLLVSLWEPPYWIKILMILLVVGPSGALISSVRHRAARVVEIADEAAERTGRRRPVSIGPDPDRRATFTWNSPAGRRLIAMGVSWMGLITTSTVMSALMWRDDPPHTMKDAAFFAFLLLVMVISPTTFGVLGIAGPLREVYRTLADPAERTLVTVIGVDPPTGLWVLERLDDETRFSARLLGGKHLLVAGDELLAEGTLGKPVNSWRRPVAAVFALTGPFGTLWAVHRDLSATALSGTSVTGTLPTPAGGTRSAA